MGLFIINQPTLVYSYKVEVNYTWFLMFTNKNCTYVFSSFELKAVIWPKGIGNPLFDHPKNNKDAVSICEVQIQLVK